MEIQKQDGPQCPHCGVGNGFVRAVSMSPRDKVLTYCCDQCLRRWETQETAPSFTGEPLGMPKAAAETNSVRLATNR